MSLSGLSSIMSQQSVMAQQLALQQQQEMMRQQGLTDTLQNAQGANLSEKLDSIAQKQATEMQMHNGNSSSTLASAQKLSIQDNMEELMLSNAAMSQMNQINGTGENDVITARPNEDGSITFRINDEEQTFSQEEVAKGFVIYSGDGNDIIDVSASSANFIINSGEGNNSVSLGSGRNIAVTGNGDNVIKGNEDGSKGTSIYTGAGKNNISLGEGSTNKVTTNGGANTITAGKGSVNDIINKNQTGETSTIQLNTDTDNYVTSLGASDITVGDGNNSIRQNNGIANIKAGDGNNTIIGGEQGNNIKVGNGNNYIEGGAGDDKIVAGDGDNIIYGLDGDDAIVAGNGDNYIDGGKGNDTVVAGNGKNIVMGSRGDDKITVTGAGGTIIDDSDGSNINAKGNNIKLYDSKATASLGQSVGSYGDSKFHQRVQSDLEVLRATESGRKLLGELDKSEHKTTIERSNQNNGGAATYIPGNDYKKYVKPNGEKGDGADAVVGYNPSFRSGDATPSVILFHELSHAYNITTGTMANGYIDENGKQVKASEHQAVGLNMDSIDPIAHPDGTISASNPDGISENAFRTELGLDLRETYL